MRKIFTKGLVATGATVAALAMTFAGGSVKANAQDVGGSLKISDIKYENSEIGTLLKYADKDKDGYLSLKEREKVPSWAFANPSSQEDFNTVLEVFPKMDNLGWNSGTLKTLELRGNLSAITLTTSASSQVELKGNTGNLGSVFYITNGTQKYTFNGKAAGYAGIDYYLDLEGEQIKDVILPDSVQVLEMRNTSTTSLNITSKKRVYKIMIYDCKSLNEMSIVNCPKLVSLDVTHSALKKGSIKSCPNLKYIDMYDSKIQKIGKGGFEIQKTPKLEWLTAIYGQLSSVDVSQIPSLRELEIQCNNVKKLKITNKKTNKKIREVNCSYNKITSLDVSKCSNLEKLDCCENKLTKLSVSENKKLSYLDCDSNKLTKLSVSENKKLQELYCGNNKLTKLSVSKNKELQSLSCGYNKLKKLSVSQNKDLGGLYCSHNKLSKLNLKNNEYLRTLDCSENKFTKIDLSKNYLISRMIIGYDYKLLTSFFKYTKYENLPYIVIYMKKNTLDLSKYAPKLKKIKWTKEKTEGGEGITMKKSVIKVSSKAKKDAEAEFSANIGGYYYYLEVYK